MALPPLEVPLHLREEQLCYIDPQSHRQIFLTSSSGRVQSRLGRQAIREYWDGPLQQWSPLPPGRSCRFKDFSGKAATAAMTQDPSQILGVSPSAGCLVLRVVVGRFLKNNSGKANILSLSWHTVGKPFQVSVIVLVGVPSKACVRGEFLQ